MRAAIATCADVPTLDEDGPGLLAALAERGVEAVPAIWDDDTVAWERFDLVVLRSTWDYPAKWEQFVAWIDQVSQVARLVNAAPVVRWNVDKRYLRSLAAAGIPTVPTWWIEHGGVADALADAWSQCEELVVKPVISAGSKDTRRFARDEAALANALARQILDSGRKVMAQPYVPSVNDYGETALLYFGGEFSHAIRKGPLLRVGDDVAAGLFRLEAVDPRIPTERERATGERVLAALPFSRESLAYARVDLVWDESAGPLVIEVELIEPSVFLEKAGASVDRFADVLVDAATQSPREQTPP